MAGYTRQSIADIINGSEVTAPPLNAEFNQVAAAFAAATGHSHDGSTGNAPKIDLATSVSGYLPAVHGGIGGKNNFAATTNPLATDDAGDGYAPGSMWENTTTGRVFICVGNTSNAAVWRELVQVQTANKIIPEATNTVDLGEPSTRFQDLWLSGGLSAFGNGSLGGTLTVTGATALGSTLAVTGDATFGNLTATGTTVITSVDLNSGAIDNAAIGTTTPAAGTFTTLNANTSLTAATADINGGTIDGATIGATSHTTGKFTTLQSTGQATLNTVDINGGNIDGTVIGAVGTAAGSFTTLSTSGQGTFATVDINGGSIDGAAIGASSASSGAFTTVSASGGLTGNLTGNVTGNVDGNVTGDVTGNVTGDLTGNVTAASGSSSFNDVTISGTLNMDANSAATITNLSAPINNNDAARKIDVDNAVANLVDSAPDSLNTLNELAAALADDDDAFNTLNTSIGTKLPKAGGTMTGAIAMSTNKITGVGDPTAAQDVSSKAYTDAQRDTRVAKSGDTMSGALAMGSNNITGLATPTANDHAVNKSYADGILGSATAAAASAAAAATSESNAATSETNASNSASAASTSEANAAASYDSFDDRYLGAKATAPTVDNDGDALVIGALYFNSTSNIMYVYGGAGWQAAGSSVNGTSDRNTYTATAGQTVFAATYDTGYVDVYLNGVKLVAGTDFTATNGTSITLATGAAVNDVVDIVAYGTFVLADHYTEAQSDARYVQVAGDTMTGNLDVQGTVTADGLTVDDVLSVITNNVNITGTAPKINIMESDTTDENAQLTSSGGNFLIRTLVDSKASAQTRIKVDHSTGDISFYDASGNAKFFWDAAAERLTIDGDANASSLSTAVTESILELNGNSAGTAAAWFGSVSGGGQYVQSSNSTGTTSYDFLINPYGGNVGIGTDLPDEALSIEDGNMLFTNTVSNNSRIYFTHTATANRRSYIGALETTGNGNALIFAPNANGADAAEAMRLDSGNLLVGKTGADAGASVGVEVTSSGKTYFTRDSSSTTASVLDVNKKTGDGAIIAIRKDGSTVGSIGTKNGALHIGSTTGSDSYLGFYSNSIIPTTSDGSDKDAVTDLGYSGSRFKDGYFSGTVNAANFNTTSDATLKTNVETLTGSLDAVKSLRGVSFDWLENGNSEVGVIAQEVEAVLPDLVSTNDQGIKSVKYGNIVAVLIEAMKEQQLRIETLEAQLNS